jgi:ferredoxin
MDGSIDPRLKNCPFCGGQAGMRQVSRCGIEIRCKSCSVTLKQRVVERQMLGWLEGIMIETWNKRVQVSDG